ncbi:4Fe-4S dicluster domain-containing protein [Chloroflexota bacterium]
MTQMIITKDKLAQVLKLWQESYQVLVPSAKKGAGFVELSGSAENPLPERYRNTVVPPKSAFLPPFEKFFDFEKTAEGTKLTLPENEHRNRLIFGIRPCDAASFGMLDKVFGDTYNDDYFLRRRDKTILVGLACTNPYDSCFCTSLGIDPGSSPDVDIMLTETARAYLAEPVSERGAKLLEASSLEKGGAEEVKTAETARDDAWSKIRRQVDIQGMVEKVTGAHANEAFWQEIGAKCVTCGVCTFLCPTCYCFDINDEALAGAGNGSRVRNWDSCSFEAYTQMPMENPREEKWRRVRQKVSHKYSYFPELFDTIACTGCGRCIRLCPVNWDIAETLTTMPAAAPEQ